MLHYVALCCIMLLEQKLYFDKCYISGSFSLDWNTWKWTLFYLLFIVLFISYLIFRAMEIKKSVIMKNYKFNYCQKYNLFFTAFLICYILLIFVICYSCSYILFLDLEYILCIILIFLIPITITNKRPYFMNRHNCIRISNGLQITIAKLSHISILSVISVCFHNFFFFNL